MTIFKNNWKLITSQTLFNKLKYVFELTSYNNGVEDPRVCVLNFKKHVIHIYCTSNSVISKKFHLQMELVNTEKLTITISTFFYGIHCILSSNYSLNWANWRATNVHSFHTIIQSGFLTEGYPRLNFQTSNADHFVDNNATYTEHNDG